MAYNENRWRNDQDRYGRSDDERDRGRSESRDWRGSDTLRGEYGRGTYGGGDQGRDTYGRGDYGRSDWMRGDWMRDDAMRGDRERDDWSRGDDRGYGGYGRDDDRSRQYGSGEYGRFGSYGGGGYGGSGGYGSRSSVYGREDYGRGSMGYGRDDWGGGRSSTTRARDYSRDYGGRSDDRGWLERAGDEIASWFGDEDAERRRRMDERRAGEHRGRGPRGYSRSDERIREDVNDRLTDDSYVDASDVDIAVSGGEVTLSGHVDSRTAKRRAEDIAESVSGVRHVQNNLRVRQPTGTGATMATGTSTAAGASAMAGMGATGTTGTTGTTGSSGTGTTGTGSSTVGTGTDRTDTRTRT